MIVLYTGTPGSGKSLHAARKIYTALRWKHVPVIANFDIRHDAPGYDKWFHFVPNDQLTPEYLEEFSRDYWQGRKVREDVLLLFVDEAQLLFNSRDWAKQKNRMQWVSFLSQHRHMGYNVTFVTQHSKMIDRQFRALVEYECHHRKVSNIGIAGKVIKVLMLGRELFCVVSTYSALNVKVSTEFFIGRKRWYEFYDSYGAFEAPRVTAEDGEIKGHPSEDVARSAPERPLRLVRAS